MLWLNQDLHWQRQAWAVKCGIEMALGGKVHEGEAGAVTRTNLEGRELARKSNARRREGEVLRDAARGRADFR